MQGARNKVNETDLRKEQPGGASNTYRGRWKKISSGLFDDHMTQNQQISPNDRSPDKPIHTPKRFATNYSISSTDEIEKLDSRLRPDF